MTSLLHTIGRFCVRHRAAVLLVWLVGFAGMGYAASSAGEQTTNDLTLAGSDSQRATDLLRRDFPAQANGTVPVVLTAPAGEDVLAGERRAAVEEVVREYEEDPLVTGVVSPLDERGAEQVSQDGETLFLSLVLEGNPGELTEEEAERLLEHAAPAEAQGLEASVGAYVGQVLSRPSSRASEVVGLAAALVILLATFGTVVAMGLPLITAVLGLVIGLSGVLLLGQVSDVPTTGPALATMIGLGVGIDYGLFVVTRHREQLAAGMELRESVARAAATSGGAVLFAGGTVVVALLSLAVAGVPLVTQLGYLSALVVAVAVLAALTLLPALLALVGRRIDALPLPGRRDRPVVPPTENRWAAIARAVTRRPGRAIAAALAVLVLLSLPAAGLELGQTDDGALPEGTQTRTSYDALSEGFGPGVNGPLLVAAELDGPASSPEDPRLVELRERIAAAPGVLSASVPALSENRQAALVTVTSRSAPSADGTEELVTTLRDEVLPGVDGLTASVGGTTARFIDLADTITEKLPLVIAVVLGLSFVLLVLAFRSLLVPLKAILVNLLSIGAAFGVVTYVFGNDWTAQAIGLDGAVPIASFVPLMMFAILFGLSMDYEVFLMSKVREEFQHHGDAQRAVVAGVGATARVITSAALIMVSVFLAFLLSGDPNIKQFGLGMAFAVAIDATIVRCLLVPAIMGLLGPRAWAMPAWLDRRTPSISIEGEAFFAARDAEEARPTPVRS